MTATTPAPTKRETTIITLCEWYPDVLAGWKEHGNQAGELGQPLMCRAWNHPSYQQLERQRLALRDADPKLYWHVAEKWLRATRRTRLVCPRCGDMLTPSSTHYDKHRNVIATHRHGRDIVFYRLQSVAVWADHVDDRHAHAGIRWMADRWQGEPFIPDEILAAKQAA